MARPIDQDGLRECSVCHLRKAPEEFRPYYTTPGYRHRQCISCERAADKVNRKIRKETPPDYWDTATHRRCGKCKKFKLREEFGLIWKTRDDLLRTCKACHREKARLFRSTPATREQYLLKRKQYRNTESSKRKHRDYEKGAWNRMGPAQRARRKLTTKKRWDNYRLAVVEKYGSRCACCGESELLFLTLDHVNNDGNLDRGIRTTKELIYDLMRNPVDPTIQLLCMNCNSGKHRNKGICPHKAMVPGAQIDWQLLGQTSPLLN